MNPIQYNEMVEKLAFEILDDCFEKEAYTEEEFNAMSPKKQQQIIAQGQKALDKKNAGYGTTMQGRSVKPMTPGQKKKFIDRANKGYVPVSNYGKKPGLKDQYDASQFGQSVSRAGQSLHDTALRAKYGDFGARKLTGFDKALIGTAGAAALGTGVGIGIHSMRKRKKQKEEAQEKAAAYFEDAQLLKEAAETIWGYADYADSEYEAILLKNAAEEAYDEAEAQEEAAINVYNGIEDAYEEAGYDE